MVQAALPEASPPEDLVAVGRVLATYGVRGALKVAADGGADSVLTGVGQVWLQARSGTSTPSPFELTAARQHGSNLLLTLRGLDSPEAAAAWRGATVSVRRAAFPPPAADELYWVDLLDCEVVSARGIALGRVVNVDDHGGGPLLRVRAPATAGSGAANPARLIPFVPAYVLDVDLPARCIRVDWEPDWD